MVLNYTNMFKINDNNSIIKNDLFCKMKMI